MSRAVRQRKTILQRSKKERLKENSAEKTVKSGNRLVRASEASRGGYAVAPSTSGASPTRCSTSSATSTPSARRKSKTGKTEFSQTPCSITEQGVFIRYSNDPPPIGRDCRRCNSKSPDSPVRRVPRVRGMIFATRQYRPVWRHSVSFAPRPC